MRWFCLGLLVLVNIVLSGCAYFQALGPDVPQKIDLLIADERYGAALDILSYNNPNKSNYNELLAQQKRVIILAEQLEKETLQETRQLVRQDEWYRAEQLYLESLAKLPDSDKLIKQYQLFLESRKILLAHLELKLDTNRAHWLIANIPVQQEMIRVFPTAEDEFSELNDFRAQKEKTALHLLRFTTQALDRKDHLGAASLIALIDRLAVDNLDEELLVMSRYRLQELQRIQRISDNLRQSKVEQQQLRLERILLVGEKKETEALIMLLEDDASLENVLRARTHLDSISRASREYPSSFELHRHLEQLYQQAVVMHSQSGRTLYSQGKIYEALEIWQFLLKIDSDNQRIQEYVDRANRVLGKLQRLKQQTASDAPGK